jgi:hypothetical protein
MTITFVTTDLTTQFTIAAEGDTLDVLPTGVITNVDTGGDIQAVYSQYDCTVNVYGTVAGGGYGLNVGEAGKTTNIYVGDAGSITGVFGVYVSGVAQVVNYGQIDSIGNTGIALTSTATIETFGSISGGFAISSYDSKATDTQTINNYGTISSTNDAIYGDDELDIIMNAGVLDGNCLLGTAASGSLTNTGTINGYVQFFNRGTLVDSGTITGTVFLSSGTVNLDHATMSLQGVDDKVTLGMGANILRLAGGWNSVTGSDGVIYEDGAQASVLGGSDIMYFSSGTGNALSLYDTMGNWDTVYGSGGTVIETVAQASILGGSNIIDISGGAGSQASLYNTAGAWDTVNGSNAAIMETSAQVSVVGGGDTIYFSNGAGNQVSLYNTAGAWDTVNGSNGVVYESNAAASLLGKSNTVNFIGSGDQVSLYNTAVLISTEI